MLNPLQKFPVYGYYMYCIGMSASITSSHCFARWVYQMNMCNRWSCPSKRHRQFDSLCVEWNVSRARGLGARLWVTWAQSKYEAQKIVVDQFPAIRFERLVEKQNCETVFCVFHRLILAPDTISTSEFGADNLINICSQFRRIKQTIMPSNSVEKYLVLVFCSVLIMLPRR